MKLTRLFIKVALVLGFIIGAVASAASSAGDNPAMAEKVVKIFKHPPPLIAAPKQIDVTLATASTITTSLPLPEKKEQPIKSTPRDTISSGKTKPVQLSASTDSTSISNLIPVPGAAPATVDKSDSADAPARPTMTTRLWNLQDADILSVINEVSQDTGKNFIVDPRVNGKITLVSSKPLKRGQVYPVFLSVLSALGYSAIPSGGVIKIVPNMESGEQATKVGSQYRPGHGDEVVVRVIPLENVSAAQLIPVIRPLLPQWSNVSSYAPGNVLILLGRADNLKRIIEVVQDVDKASNSGIQMVHLKRASAQQVASVLNNLQTASRASGETPTVSIAVDERSNSLLLGGPQSARLKMRVLISQLDAKTADSSGNTEVVYLRYLQAKTLAPILSKIAENLLGKEVKSSAPESVAPAAKSTNTATKKSTTSTASVNTFIQAEPNTNAIVITAQPALMAVMKSVISKLDVRPAQVLVQAIIAEIDENSLTALGIQWGSADGNGQFTTTGTSLLSFPSLGAGIVGLIPGSDIQAVLSVLQNNHGVDILSTPSIMVLDNQKATIEVGQDVPFQTGTYATTGGANTVTPFTTIDQKAVTLKLDVTPQINLGKAVRLKLNLKNDTLQNPQNPGLNPIINTSKIANSVIINSDDILVLGGLMSNSNNESINKVPILGDIPILGKMLFTQKITSYEKKNLMVFLKPIILHDSELAMTISQEKYSQLRSTQANYVDDMAKIGKQRQNTLLPPWKNEKDLPNPFETAS